jgi:hypothetical protein
MDREVIEHKLESLRRCLQRVEEKCPSDPDRLSRDPDLQDIVTLNLSRAVQLCVDPARIIHERFCCNRRSAATTSLRPAGSPLGPSPYCASTHRVLTAPRAGLATRLSDFATNRHE